MANDLGPSVATVNEAHGKMLGRAPGVLSQIFRVGGPLRDRLDPTRLNVSFPIIVSDIQGR